MQIGNHPEELLQKEWIDILRNHSKEAGQHKQLHPEQIQLLYDNDWLKALVAKDYGGLEWTLPQIVSFEEAIGWADGSAGWVFTLCSGAGWFSGFLNKDFGQKIFSEKNVCLAGSGAVSGVAKKINDHHFLINGSWQYASGAPFATVFTANCFIEEEQKVKAFCFLRDEVVTHKTWNSIGLVASSTESFSVSDLVVPAERCFEIDAAKAVVQSPLYQYPFKQLAESTIAANISGMALHFMEACEALFKEKKYGNHLLWDNEKLRQVFRQAQCDWSDGRSQLHATVDISWNELLNNKKISGENLLSVSSSSQQLAKVCRHIVNSLYPFTGLTGANKDSAVNQVWRDFQTGSQHTVFMDI